MDQKPKSSEKIQILLEKGVEIPKPLTIDIGDEVRPERISGEGVKIYPGCRIYGADTVLSAGCRLGYEAPVTIDNCALGPKVELKGGYFTKAVFLENANMGSGAQVREGTLLEEEANGAHCVGLKQTILFPFVTLGSLINFCDCFMAGGTSRKNHSEVGSSYIHFNYTPNQDKATASLIGDVPRGVMLNQPPIFLGGQGGMVGPLRLGFGNVIASGSILRRDYLESNQLISSPPSKGATVAFVAATYPSLARIIRNNILYIANLAALEAWYMNIRKAFFEPQKFGDLIYRAALKQLDDARTERLKRLRAIPNKNVTSQIGDCVWRLETLSAGGIPNKAAERDRDAFLSAFQKTTGAKGNYIETIQNLPPEVSSKGVEWLNGIVTGWCERAAEAVPSLNLFKKE